MDIILPFSESMKISYGCRCVSFIIDIAFHFQSFGVKDRIDDLSDIEVNLTDIDILSEDLNTQLDKLANSELDDINFDSFKAEVT